MEVKKLEINGFRNLNNFSINFGDKKNLIFGVNGSGKTSVIEALFLLGFGKSFLPVNKKELVNFNASGFFVKAEILNKSGENTLTARLEKSFYMQANSEKAVFSQTSHYLYPLFFSSSNYNYYIDYMAYFRKLMDRFIHGVHSLYLHDVLRYNNILKQKNYLLKNLGKSINHSELNSWNTVLAESGCKIVKKRMAFINQLNDMIGEIFRFDLKINYFPALLTTAALSENSIFNDLCLIKNSEINRKRSLLGPQRDRFDIMVSGKKVQLFSSGEKKKYLMMIFAAYIDLFRKERNDYPVFLIDDYDAAMDENNLNFLMDHFSKIQIIATSVAKNEKFGHLFELKKEN
ncbi:MAG: DNA replication and repair protein RecF [Candidatus Aminicenantes bacterium]|nr:DNA replication and repair protein RecF [Candidatus Aminicenantes bacterium]